MGKGRGGGKTPTRVVELLKQAVEGSSQVAVANATGLTRLTVQRYLKGIGEPSQETLGKLASYFKVSVGELRGEAYAFNVEKAEPYVNDIFETVKDLVESNGPDRRLLKILDCTKQLFAIIADADREYLVELNTNKEFIEKMSPLFDQLKDKDPTVD
ncbi:helix-turn-helix domain-containing protein [Geomonas agri]|uniref:helix-turn-helix domain-containing protein n=1 Tax=Geomonas agri TaxID=2873702 RepID=UPI001CD1B0B5|nr:helix-turn-helix transcriptional regulator [Geomonas agri]